MGERLLGVIRGCAYRRRYDAAWTMEFMTSRCREITGYDPHRFIDNASLSFAELIVPEDRRRVNQTIAKVAARHAVATVSYRITAAFGRVVRIEDRLIPIYDEAGNVTAIEGVLDLAPATEPRRPQRKAGLRRLLRPFLQTFPTNL